MITILIDCELTELTGDWIWRFAHCKGVWKQGDADWCYSSSLEITRYLHEHRDEVIMEIQERFSLDDASALKTFNEWIEGLASIQQLAKLADEDCRWIEGTLSQKTENAKKRILSYIDQLNETQPNSNQ